MDFSIVQDGLQLTEYSMYKIKQKLNKRWGDISTLFDLKKASQKKFENIQKNIDENESVE